MPSKTVNGAAIAYIEKGSGQPLVLLHGFPLDGRIFDAQIDRLSKSYRVIAPDLRGFGRSINHQPFTIASLADDIRALLASIDALPCALAGLSMGGYVALAFIKKHPLDVRSLILIDTRAAGDTAEGKAGRMKMVEQLHSSGSKAIAREMMPKMLAEKTVKENPAVVQKLRQIMESCPPPTIAHALLAMRDREDYTDLLPSIASPTLIIVGQADPITPPSFAQAMHEAIDNSELVEIANASHISTMDRPGEVSDAIESFLKNQ